MFVDLGVINPNPDMKTVLPTFLTLAITSFAFAQQPDKALTRVTYNFTHIQDTTQKERPYTETMLLIVGKNASVFTSYDKIKKDVDMQNQLKEQMKNQAGSNQLTFKINGMSNVKTSSLDYFFFANENKFFTKETVFNNYLIEENAPKINWKITKDTASFAGVHCQKAITYFRGRNWIAWYGPDLPFQSGPWKLNGLPGLIIEAYDENREVHFKFDGMENVIQSEIATENNGEPTIKTSEGTISFGKMMGADNGSTYLGNDIKLPTDAIKTTRKEIDKLKEAREKDPQGFIKAQMAGIGGMVSVVQGTRIVSNATTEAGPKIEFNNPIELPEKIK